MHSQLVSDSKKVLGLCRSCGGASPTPGFMDQTGPHLSIIVSTHTGEAHRTDLSTNDEGDGKRREENGGDDDVDGALRPPPLQRTSHTETSVKQTRHIAEPTVRTNPEEGAQGQPHLDVLHFLQTEVRNLGLLGLTSRSEMTEVLRKQESLRGNRTTLVSRVTQI